MADIKTRQIKAWMVLNGYTLKKIAQMYGSHLCLVGRVINGERTSEPLKRFMIGLGCKAGWFAKPKQRRRSHGQ